MTTPISPPTREMAMASARNWKPYLAVGGAQRLANANFADARADRRQHDVHDPNAADQQDHRRHQQQHQGQGIGGLFRQYDQLREIHDVVHRLGPVPALDDPADLLRCRLTIEGSAVEK